MLDLDRPMATIARDAPLTHQCVPVTRQGAIDALAYLAAVALAGAAAWFSVRGMTVLFPGAPLSVVGMAVAMEAAKLVTAGWLAARWQGTSSIWRGGPHALFTNHAV